MEYPLSNGNTEEAIGDKNILCSVQSQYQIPLMSVPDEIQGVLESCNWRLSTYTYFRTWSLQNKKWIKFGVDFSLQHNAMRQVLKNINAPYKVWVTVKRNPIKYTNLGTVTFQCCDGHMLLRRLLQ